MIKYKRNVYKNRHIYFIIKEEKVFDEYVGISEKVTNIIN